MCRAVLMTFAFLLILFGISGLYMMPKLVQQKIEQQLQLKIGTKNYDRFTNIPIPLTVKFYLFNVTNSEQVLAGLERPKFQEVGPFVFKQWRRREVVDFEDYNRRIRYREYKTFIPMFKNETQLSNELQHKNSNYNNFDNNDHHDNKLHSKNQDIMIAQQQQSNNKQQPSSTTPFMLDPSKTKVTIINLPLLAMLTKMAQLLEAGTVKRNLASKVVSRLIKEGKEKILINKPVNQILFDGYRVDFMESIRDLVSETLGFNFDSPLPGNKFGFFYGKNGTWNRKENGELTVFTGRNESMNDFMLVDNWNDQKVLKFWNTEAGNRCNQIRGTDGSQFHPGVTKQQVLSIFSPLICTSIFIKYKEETSIKDIPLLRFTTPAEVFAAPKKSPQNACYCTIPPPNHQTSNGKRSSNETPASSKLGSSAKRINDSRCYLDGLMDLSLCRDGAPIAASSPHFYNADPMLAMASGLTPNQAIHETYLDIEPMTGAVFRAASRAQINAYVEQAALEFVDSSIIGNMTPMVAPLMWLEESAEIDDKVSKEFKGRLLNTVQKAKRSFIYATIGGIVLALAVSIQYWYVTCYSIDITPSSKPKKGVSRAQISAAARRRHRDPSTGRQVHENICIGAGARQSNLAASKSRSPLVSGGLNKGAAAKAVGAAVVLGAANAGSSSLNRHRDRTNRPTTTNIDRVDDYDEEESSKRRLVDWDQVGTADATTSGTSSKQSSPPCDEQSSMSDDDEARRPTKDDYDYRQEEDDLI